MYLQEGCESGVLAGCELGDGCELVDCVSGCGSLFSVISDSSISEDILV